MRTTTVKTHTRVIPQPRLRCPHCKNTWCIGRSGLAKHAIKRHGAKP